MKRTKRWLALLLAGVLTVPNAAVLRAEELTDGAMVEEITSEELLEVGDTTVIEVPDPVEIKDTMVSPEKATFMRSGDKYSVSCLITGTKKIPFEGYFRFYTIYVDSNGNINGDTQLINFNFDQESGRCFFSSDSFDLSWCNYANSTIIFDKNNMSLSFSTQIEKSEYYCLGLENIVIYYSDRSRVESDYLWADNNLYIDDDCADGKHTIRSNTEFIIDQKATCTEPGSQSKHCIKCNSIVEETVEEIPALGHEWQEQEWRRREPTCVDDGQKTYYCTRCPEYKYETLPATGVHTSQEVEEIKPTCNKVGYTKGTRCSVCGQVLEGCEEIPMIEHSWEELYRNEASCDWDGNITYRCSVCGQRKEEKIPAFGEHDWEEINREEPTCGYNGYVEYKCSRCGQHKSETLPATGEHEWGDWEYSWDGQKYRRCQKCNARESEVAELSIMGDKFIGWISHNSVRCVPRITEGYEDKEYKLYYQWITVDQEIPENLTSSDKTKNMYGWGEDIEFEMSLETDKDVYLLLQAEDKNTGTLSNVAKVLYKLADRPREPKKYEELNYTVNGLEEPLEFRPNKYYAFSVETDGSVDSDFEEPVVGDVYWKPAYWFFEDDGVSRWDFNIGFLSGIDAETSFPIMIHFVKIQHSDWDGYPSEIDRKDIKYYVKTKSYSDSTVTPTPSVPDIIYVPVTPTPAPVDHEAYIPPIEECSVTGTEERYYAPGKYYSFKGVGTSAETKYSVRTVGDGKWIPAYWSFDEAGEDNDTRFKLGHDDGITAGTHDLYVWFRLYTWNGTYWVATDIEKSIKTQFTALEAPEPTPTPEPEPSVTAPKTVITKLEDTGSGNLRIYWRSMEDKVDGYQIRWSINKDMTGVKTATYTGINNTTRPNLSVGKVYYVGVRTFVMNDGKKVYSEWSGTKALKLTRTLATPSVSGTSQKGTGIQTKWFTVADAEGYQLRFCQDPSFKGASTASVSGQNKTSFTKYGLGSGTWYVAVRAYKTAEDGVRYYSAWSGAQIVRL